MFHTFGYKTGFIHVSTHRGAESVRWQCAGDHGDAKSVHAAKIAITRAEQARLEYWQDVMARNIRDRQQS